MERADFKLEVEGERTEFGKSPFVFEGASIGDAASFWRRRSLGESGVELGLRGLRREFFCLGLFLVILLPLGGATSATPPLPRV